MNLTGTLSYSFQSSVQYFISNHNAIMMIIQCISISIGDKNNEKDTLKYMYNSKIEPLNLLYISFDKYQKEQSNHS